MRNHNVDNIEAALVVFFDAYRRSRSNLGSDTRLAQLSLAEFAPSFAPCQTWATRA